MGGREKIEHNGLEPRWNGLDRLTAALYEQHSMVETSNSAEARAELIRRFTALGGDAAREAIHACAANQILMARRAAGGRTLNHRVVES